jgi:hypothetical protein
MEAATVMSNKEVQLCVYDLTPYDVTPDEGMCYVDGGLYHVVAEGLTDMEEHLGLGVGTGVRGQAKVQGCVIAVNAASHADLQEGMMNFAYALPPRGGRRRTAVRPACLRMVHTSYPGRDHRRGCISLTSRRISRWPRVIPG